MINKLKKKNGETLSEALISLLIAVLSLGVVASASLAAAKINENTRKADIAFAEELQEAELYLTGGTQSKDIRIEFTSGEPIVETVKIYGEGSRFASYRQ